MKCLLLAAVVVLFSVSAASAQHPHRFGMGAYTPYNAFGYYYPPVFGGYTPVYGGFVPTYGYGFGYVPSYGVGAGSYNAYGGFGPYGAYGGVNATGWGWGGAF